MMNNTGDRATTMCLTYFVLPLAMSSVMASFALRSVGITSIKRGASSSALRRSRERWAAARDLPELLYRGTPLQF